MFLSKKLFSLLISLLFVKCVYALGAVANVDIVKGDVTKLPPGALVASIVSTGDKLTQDTSIVTGNKSFIRITFIDQTKMNVGPNSKIVINNIKSGRDDKSVISLLRGKVRTSVEKDSQASANKLILKTRTAALGVRGTDFQTIYNPENKITNLLTFRGEVAMVNIQMNEDLHKATEISELVRGDDLKLTTKKTHVLPDTQLEKLDSLLNADTTLVVKAGQFSATTNELGNISLPTTINQAQLGILYQNDTFLVKDAKESKIIKDASEINKYTQLDQVAQETSVEGFYDQENKIYAPKAGGFIDLATGLYVPPEADAIFDLDKKVYLPRTSGKLEADTGEYIAPEGLKLSASKGFVLTSREGLKDEELITLAKSLNTSVGKDLFIKKKVEKDLKVNYYSLRESFTHDQLELTLSSFSDSMEFNASTISRDQVHDKDGGAQIRLTWLGASDGIYRPRIGVSYKAASYNKDSLDRDSSGLYAFKFGFDRYISRRSFFNFGVNIHQELLGSPNSNQSDYFLQKATLTSLFTGISFDAIKSQKFSINTSAAMKSNFYKNSEGLRVKAGIGFELGLGVKYWYRKNDSIKLEIYSDYQSNGIEKDSEKFDFNSSESGLRFVFAHIF